jgi:uncharacterized coiled-coil protein SlyX
LRERRISERLESLLEELQTTKERQAHERSIFEKAWASSLCPLASFLACFSSSCVFTKTEPARKASFLAFLISFSKIDRSWAESALANVSAQLSEAQLRERRISERLESLLEELQTTKERSSRPRIAR